MDISLNPDEKKNKWRDNNWNLITLKAAVTKADNKSEEADDSKTVFSDLTFRVAAAPAQVQLHSDWATWDIP